MKWNHWNIICAELPTIYDSERFLLLLCTNFISTSCVFWVKSKHHIQHISVAFGLFSILFSPTDQKQKPSRAGSAMETSSCTRGLLCFHSSNRPCAIPKSVSGSGYQKIIVCCLSILSGVYLGNGRRCRYCISLIGNFLCTFIQQVRGYVGIPNFVLGQKNFWLSKWKRQKESVETKEKRNETACIWFTQ